MRAIGVIPSRWASTRLPGKSLVQICGKPLVQWVVEAAGRASRLDRVIVATDDERILNAMRSIGADAVMTAPEHPSGTDRVAEAVEGEDAEIIVNIQGDEPLIDPALIDALISRLASDESWDMATAATPIRHADDIHNPSVVKVVCDEAGGALYFSRCPIPYVREPEDADHVTHLKHLGIYAYRREFLARFVSSPPTSLEQAERLEQLRALHLGGRIAVVETAEEAIGVDTPEDVALAEAALRQQGRV